MRRCSWFLIAALAACGGGGGSGDDDPGDQADDGGDGDDQADDGQDGELVCDPRAGGPYWLTEGETVTVQAECATGLTGEPLAIEPLPAGAEWDAATATLTWTPGLDQGAVYELDVTGAGEVGTVKIGVADRWDDPDNQPVDPMTYTEEYGLPVFHLGTDPALNADDYTPATIIYRGHAYAAAQAKNRGASSLDYPQRSFTLKFSREDKFADQPASFLGKRKVVLNTTFDDNSYLRQRLVFELWNRLDPDHIRVQHYSAVLFLDGQYHGLYEVLDHIDEYLMEDHGYRQEGNLYKAVNHDANFRMVDSRGDPKDPLHAGYEKKEGLPAEGEPGAFADLEELIEWVATSTDEDFHANLDQHLDRRDFEDWWMLISLVEADDSGGKNSYLYNDPLTDAPFRAVPWDFNNSFGQDWETNRQAPTFHPDEYTWPNEVFERLLADPTASAAMYARYHQALAGVWSREEVLSVFETWASEIQPSALRNEARWGTDYAAYWSDRTDLTTHEQELQYIRQWIQDRWAFVDALDD